jgi:CubicO group peptidase (beta-lactamase class C family)
MLTAIGAGAQKTGLPEEVEKSIQARIAEGLNPSIVVGIIDANGPQYHSYGLTREGGSPVNEHSLYEIGSITKVFTATLLAQEILAKKMKVDDPIKSYLPKSVKVPVYAGGGPEITLGHLSDHTSALPGFPTNYTPTNPDNPFEGITQEIIYDFISDYSLTREVGSQYEYSNLAVALLGNIIAQSEKMPYEELVIKNICQPLHMKETAITLTPGMKDHLAYGHAMGGEMSNWDLGAMSPAGALKSSVHDMLIFLAANMGLEKTKLLEAFQLTHQQRHANGNRMGLGWHIANGTDEDIFWHTGGTGGYLTFCGFKQGEQRGVVVLTNADTGAEDIGFHLLDAASPLREVKPVISTWIKRDIDAHGPAGLEDRYAAEKKANPTKYTINESGINHLGYGFLGRENYEAALQVFHINVMEYPNSSNAYDSYGEALMKSGRTEEAITNYQKSLELNPGNTNAISMLEKMGVKYEVKEVTVDEAILQTYVGTYELAPGFNIVITRDGQRLFGQATGQSQFELFANSPTEFYLKVVEAKVVFNTNTEGVVSMTLFQGGAVMPGRRL